MQFLPDEPIETEQDDLLHFDDFIDLVQMAIRETKPPFVYGVLGDWGVGKTSILNLLRKRFEESFGQDGPYSFIPIWFNAWEYENQTNIVYPLLHTIKAAHAAYVAQHSQGIDTAPFKEKFKEVVGTSTLVLADMGIRIVTNHLFGETLKADDIKKQYDVVLTQQDEMTEALGQWTDSVSQLKKAFDQLLTIFAQDVATMKGVQAGGVRFVLLIDDLDRCLPDTTIALLENIKNHLTMNRLVYVMGLNPQVVYQGIRMKYAGLDINGREYLEKILNYTFYVPELDSYQVERFVTQRIRELVPEPAAQHSLDPQFRTFAQVVRNSGFNNPRKIKRILNKTYSFRRIPMRSWCGSLIVASIWPHSLLRVG